MDFVTTQQHSDRLMAPSNDSFELACKLLYLICQQLHQNYQFSQFASSFLPSFNYGVNHPAISVDSVV